MKKIVAMILVPVMLFSYYGDAYHEYGRHTEFNSASYEPMFGIHSDGVELIEDFDSMDEFVDACYNKGYSIILFNALPWEYYFVSPTLERLGWEFGEDMLTSLLDKAHEKGMKVFVDIQSLAWKVREDYEGWPGDTPSIGDVVSVVEELISYGVDGISEEEFLADWFPPVYEKCIESGVTYLHKGIPYDMVWFCNESSTVFDAFSNCNVLMTEDYYMNDDLARNCIIPSFASGLNRSYWMKSCPDDWALGSIENMKNVMRMRMVQYKPQYIFAMIYDRSDFEEFDPSSVLPAIQDYVLDEEKPLCNVVVYLTNEPGTNDNPKDLDPWQLLDVSFSAIANGIMSSGYNIKITSSPLQNADAYYVYTRGGWWDETNILDLPDSIVSLFYGNKTVFLEVAANLPVSTPNWQKVRGRIGIDNSIFDAFFAENEPIKGNYNGISYTHMGSDWCLFNEIKPSNVNGEVLSTCSYNGSTYALIVKNGNCIFVNGAGLDFNASFPISSILGVGNGLQSPCKCISTTGIVSTFYATGDTPLHIKLPYHTSSLQWTKIDINGNVQSGSAQYDEEYGYNDYLGKGTLLLLKGIGGINVSMSKPANSLYINDREIMPLKSAVIIGRITISGEATGDFGIKSMAFYVDGEMKYNDSEAPYAWLWDEHSLGRHEIMIKAYDMEGNVASEEKEVWIFNL